MLAGGTVVSRCTGTASGNAVAWTIILTHTLQLTVLTIVTWETSYDIHKRYLIFTKYSIINKNIYLLLYYITNIIWTLLFLFFSIAFVYCFTLFTVLASPAQPTSARAIHRITHASIHTCAKTQTLWSGSPLWTHCMKDNLSGIHHGVKQMMMHYRTQSCGKIWDKTVALFRYGEFYKVVDTTGCLSSQVYKLCISTSWKDLSSIWIRGKPHEAGLPNTDWSTSSIKLYCQQLFL